MSNTKAKPEGRDRRGRRDRQDDLLGPAHRLGDPDPALPALHHPVGIGGAEPLSRRLHHRLEVVLRLQPPLDPVQPAAVQGKDFLHARPSAGDIIVFKLPRDGNTDYIKRLVGLPGDPIQVRQGHLVHQRQAPPQDPVKTIETNDRERPEPEADADA